MHTYKQIRNLLGKAKRCRKLKLYYLEAAVEYNGKPIKLFFSKRAPKAMHSVKEYVQAEYLGEKQIVPVYQYVCYANNYDMGAIGLHELYKQRWTVEFCDERDQSKLVLNWRAKKQNLRSETWIE